MTSARNLLLIFYVAGKSGAREQYFTNLKKLTHLWGFDFFTFLQKILHPLFFQSVETVGDLYMDVAEACAENGTKLYKMTSLGSFIVYVRLRACWQWCANGCNNFQQCWDLQCIVGRIQPISLCKPCVLSVRGPNNVGGVVCKRI